MTRDEKPAQRSETRDEVAPPSIALPRGGGAIRGIGEKFAANPVTGTGALSVPIATSPGRSGFGPKLALSYDSGSGNGPFGFGWSLSLPAITRKTDQGLPRYEDDRESDVFILSAAEDLVPVLGPDGRRLEDLVTAPGYTIHRYRPRVEGLFARIERWTRRADGDVHWRSLSRDNVLTLYGADAGSRIAHPADPRRVFSWLICETRDDRGDAILYGYKPEDGTGVDLGRPQERNRGPRNDPRRAASRYIKRIRYGSRTPLLDSAGRRPRFLTTTQVDEAAWMFEVVFDYGEHDPAAPTPDDAGPWTYRDDPFSSYRAGFEVRTTRLCRRVLMFHHFPDEPDVGRDCLVRSTDIAYSRETDPAGAPIPLYTFLQAVRHMGYRRTGAGYVARGLPPVEFEYVQPAVQDTVSEVDATSLANLPVGLDAGTYHWADLHGEGIPGILTEQAGAWFYKRNVSPLGDPPVAFAPLERVAVKPSPALAGGQAQFMDLAGDGQPDLVVLDDPVPGLYEHDGREGWGPFRPFAARLQRSLRDPNLRFVDLDGDGHADVLITEDDALVWHASRGEEGFGPAARVARALDEEQGPRLVFADGARTVHLADMSGDGLTDLVRIDNGEVCYWPNLGHGRFGAKVTMDRAPRFDTPDQFDPERIRLADLDGTGTTDIVYLHRDGVRLYLNQSGNGWSAPHRLPVFPRVDDGVAIVPVDLLGNGTACLVWSSSLPADARRPLRYVSLMGGRKPHLLARIVNNLGAETRVQYAPSSTFYLRDRRDGRPWISRLPFPVHVVERVETYDHVSRNCFVTRYAYHHGYFDGLEREFRGFGMVEQWDTETFAALAADGSPEATNVDASSHVPPVLTRTWFHTGIHLGRDHVSDFFAGLRGAQGRGEYYREPGLTDAEARARLLPDTVLPDGLTLPEEREACRALKGAMLRQEVYGLDGTPKAEHPYTVTEQNFTVRRLQPRGTGRHAVFLTHPRETVTYHHERVPADPRIAHRLTLEVDDFGSVLREAAVGYARRQPDPTLSPPDRDTQSRTLVTYTENRFTNPITDPVAFPDDYRAPLPCEVRTYELTGVTPAGDSLRFSFDEWTRDAFALAGSAAEIPYEQAADPAAPQKRLIEHKRTLYRRDDLTALLPLGALGARALPGQSLDLAFTPGLLAGVFQREGQPLLADPAEVLGSRGADGGGYVASQDLKAAGSFPETDPDDHWWAPGGRVFLSPEVATTAEERVHAQRHFFLPHRHRDPFHAESVVVYDAYDLLILETRDAVGNRVTAGERDPDGRLVASGNDYRVLQPRQVMDPNRNRTRVAFDALGLMVGTAVMGKPEEARGDSLDDFQADLPEVVALAHLADPLADPRAILGRATTRLVYDLFAYQRTRAEPAVQPAVVYTLARETHESDLLPDQATRVRHGFSYSDGFGREIQQKIPAEPGPLTAGGSEVAPRWVGSGWTLFNNKGRPVRRYEPFFSASHRFEFARTVGVSPVLFYDPTERVVATLHPNHTYEKVVFGPWREETWDVNDTALQADPRDDPDAGDFFRRLPEADYLPTWHAARKDGLFGSTAAERRAQRRAAAKTAVLAGTPEIAHFDPLGRRFLVVAHNRLTRSRADGTLELVEERYPTRTVLDIEGNQREVIDAMGRIVVRYDHDLSGARIHHTSMEAGERWAAHDATGQPIRAWNSRGHTVRRTYDVLRRPTEVWLGQAAVSDRLVERTVYGETHAEAEARNLRGKAHLALDGAGVVSNDAYDFKGNLLESHRRLAREYRDVVDWSAVVPLDGPGHASSIAYDALNRPVASTTPDASVIRHAYNEAGLLERIDAALRGEEPVTTFVADVGYNARGQRERIEYGNGVRTTYAYDPLTFRLTRLRTVRAGTALQDLSYTYDPAGNITEIRDAAQQTVYFGNHRVEPSAEFTYDALYRLIEASGREHLGQTASGAHLAPAPPGHTDLPRVGLPHPADGQAMGRYLEEYTYDPVGNLRRMLHRGTDPAHPGWTRTYDYAEPSLLEPDVASNRLSSTVVGDGVNAIPEVYAHDLHGSMTSMPHLRVMEWDFEDQLHVSQTQAVEGGPGPRTYYVYDASGQRVRKLTESTDGARQRERIYLGAFEIHRAHGGDGTTVTLERETLHVMDGAQRVALVETRTQGDDGSPLRLVRFQLGNHLGSVSLELDEEAHVLSYEEYYPYGSTSHQSGAPKRYRYTAKERDEETGLYYHGARYYAAWLGRWTSCDPTGVMSGVNAYVYVRCRPVRFVDPHGKWEWSDVFSGLSETGKQVRSEVVDLTLPGQLLGGARVLYGVAKADDSLEAATREAAKRIPAVEAAVAYGEAKEAGQSTIDALATGARAGFTAGARLLPFSRSASDVQAAGVAAEGDNAQGVVKHTALAIVHALQDAALIVFGGRAAGGRGPRRPVGGSGGGGGAGGVGRWNAKTLDAWVDNAAQKVKTPGAERKAAATAQQMRDAGARIADELKKGGPEGQKLAAEFERNLEARISEAEKAAGAELGETMKKEAAEAARKEQRGVRHVKQPGADKAYDPFRSLRPGPKDPKR